MMTVNFKKDRRGAAANQTLFWVVFGVIVLGFVVLLLTGALDKGAQPQAFEGPRVVSDPKDCPMGEVCTWLSPLGPTPVGSGVYGNAYAPVPTDPCLECEGDQCLVTNPLGGPTGDGRLGTDVNDGRTNGSTNSGYVYPSGTGTASDPFKGNSGTTAGSGASTGGSATGWSVTNDPNSPYPPYLRN